MNVSNYNYRYARRLVVVVLLVLACSVVQTNCKKSKNSNTTEENDQTVSIVATTIQRCVDEKTMNNKKFKAKLNDLYKEIIQPKIQISINEYMIKVNNIKKQYADDVKILKRMNSNNGDKNTNKNKKNKNK